MGTKLSPHSRKITLVEIDFGQNQDLWFNYTAGVWYIDFDAIYDRIDPVYLIGVSAQPIVRVGSVLQDGVALTLEADVATCITTNNSFYWDVSERRVYIHLDNGDEHYLHTVTLGITTGVANHAVTYSDIYYEPRLKSAPNISKSTDPLFFGRISFDGGDIGIDNADGQFDGIVTGAPTLFGGAIRVYQGFDDDAFVAFSRHADGVIDGVTIDRDMCTIRMVDKRKMLSRTLPPRTYTIGAYPDINENDLGKFIPLVWGDCKKVPCVCLNQEEVTPAHWHFKVCDCIDHAAGIESIDHVYANGIEMAPVSTDLPNGEFIMYAEDYFPGDDVTADVHGFTDATPTLIENAADVIADLLVTYQGLTFNATFFNLAEWAAAQALAMDVGVWIDDSDEVFSVIEDICASALLNFIQQDDGIFTLRVYDPARAVAQTLSADELLETPTIEYDSSQVLTSTNIGYDRDWDSGRFQKLHDVSQQTAIFATYKVYRERAFDTLLTNAVDAQTFSDAILALSGKVMTKVTARFKLQPLGRELMDFIMLPVYRQTKAMLGMTKCEIFSINKDLIGATVELGCRVV